MHPQGLYFYFLGFYNLWLGHVTKRYGNTGYGALIAIARALNTATVPIVYGYLAYTGVLTFSALLSFCGALAPINFFVRGFLGSQYSATAPQASFSGVAHMITMLNIMFGALESFPFYFVFFVAAIVEIAIGESPFLSVILVLLLNIVSSVAAVWAVFFIRARVVNLKVFKQIIALAAGAVQTILAIFIFSFQNFAMLFVLVPLAYIFVAIWSARESSLQRANSEFNSFFSRRVILQSVILNCSKILFSIEKFGVPIDYSVFHRDYPISPTYLNREYFVRRQIIFLADLKLASKELAD